MTRAERIAELEAELARIKAEEEAERGLVEYGPCWNAMPNGTVEQGTYISGCGFAQFPFTDDGKRKADRAGKLFSSLSLEDPPFEVGQEVFYADAAGGIGPRSWANVDWQIDAWHQGRIKATEAEAAAWRDKFNGAWTGGGNA